MTETQATSGTAGASTTPADEEAAGGGTSAAGRAVVGRATVPADAPSPKFTRAPGMPPPPDQLSPDQTARIPDAPASGSPANTAVADRTQPVATPSSAPPAQSEQKPVEGRVAAPGQQGQARSGIGGAAAVGAARVTEAVRAARSTVNSAASRGPRRARLNLKRIDPWSVMKFSAAVSVVLFIVVIVATSVLYLALDAMGVFKSVNSSLTDLVSAGGGASADSFRITAKGVIGTSALIGLVNVVLFTALATLGAFIYNVCADLVGGIEVTLAERD
jgi:hypothetical protein